jgi:glycosyltransferase involved in cell wall biosynthesis
MVVRTALAAKRRGYEVVVVVHRPVAPGNPSAIALRLAGVRLLAPAAGAAAALRTIAAGIRLPLSLAAVLPYALLRRMPIREAWHKVTSETSWSLQGRPMGRLLDRRFERALALSCARRPCLIHLHSLGWPSCGLALRWAQREGVPLLFHFHNDLDRAQVNSLGRIFSGREREKLLKHPVFVALTPSIAEKLRGFLGEAARVISVPNWVDEPPAAAAGDVGRGPYTVCFIGRVVGGKGVEDLMRAVARLLAEGQAVRCTIVGSGVGIPYMRDYASRLGVASEIEFVGERDPREAQRLLASADALVLLSETEGLPLVLLEAYALGKPVITTPVGGIPDVFVDGTNGFLVRPGEIDGLAAAIRRLAGDRPLAVRCGEMNRKAFLERFSEDAVWPRLERVYEEIAGGPPVHPERGAQR